MSTRLSAVLLGAVASLLTFAAPAGATRLVTNLTFDAAKPTQTWTVPAQANTARITIWGAQGGGGTGALAGGMGGSAAITFSTLTPGQVYSFVLGGKGADSAFVPDVSAGGFNGGGRGANNAWGGGGRTDLSVGGERIAVAGGGGGGGGCALGSTTGGAGGGLTGTVGAKSGCGGSGSSQGQPGTQTAGGAGGSSTFGSAQAGAAGIGGGGYDGGAGGGGGYYGGGGATGNDGAGGGSGYLKPGLAGTFETGVNVGDGRAEISYTVPSTIAMSTAGTGGGVVASNPGDLDCGRNVAGHTDCSTTVPHNTSVTLVATPNANSEFVGFTGTNQAAAGVAGLCQTSSVCTVPASADLAIQAEYRLKARQLTVTTAGVGGGYIDSAPAGIDCGRNIAGHADCAQTFGDGDQITLIARPDASSDFAGFSECPGASTCTVTLTDDLTVTGTFVKGQRPVVVSATGNGNGTVTSSPAGITCTRSGGITQGPCTLTADYGAAVTLTGTAGADSTFAGFSGACTGTAPCTVTLDAQQFVTATFTRNPKQLKVAVAGAPGNVKSSPSGVNCDLGETGCAEIYAYNTSVTLTATPAAGKHLEAWTGDAGGCTASSLTCTLTMNQARNVTAQFAANERTLTVEASTEPDPTETGGTVTSDPAGITCGSQCSTVADEGTEVQLTAAPMPGYRFAGYEGAGCGADPDCTIALGSADVSVGATFTRPVPVTENATDVTLQGATLRGSFDTAGADVRWWFTWTSATGTPVKGPEHAASASETRVNVTEAVGELSPSTVYDYELVVAFNGAEWRGGTQQLTVPDPTPTPTPAPTPTPSPAPAQATPAPAAVQAPLAAAGPLTISTDGNSRRCIAAKGARVKGAKRSFGLRFRLGEASKVTFTVERRTKPRRSAPKACPPKAPSDDDTIPTYTAVRGLKPLVLSAKAGLGTVKLSQLIGTKRLAPGRYRVTVKASRADGANAKAGAVRFWVVAGK